MYETWRVIQFASIIVAALISLDGCLLLHSHAEDSSGISREKAIEIANKTIVDLGYDLTELRVIVDEGNKLWNEYAEAMKGSKNLPPEVLKDFEQKETKLRGHSFWHIAYKFKPEGDVERLGGAGVFVDATQGQVLLVIPGH